MNIQHIPKTWSILRKVMGKLNKKTSFPQTCLINGTLITDKFQITEGFNNYFKKIGIQTNQNMPQSNKVILNRYPDVTCIACFLTQCTI